MARAWAAGAGPGDSPLTIDLDSTICETYGLAKEFAGKAMDESFNGRLRDECLNINWFMSVRHAREIIESWRQDYNEVRPHSSLKGKTPKEFAGSMAGLY